MQNRYVYFIRDGLGHIKIGVANNLKNRLSALQTANPMKLELYQAFKVESVKVAYKIEHRLHIYFKDDKLMGEWFDENEIIKFLDQKRIIVDGYEFTNFLIDEDELFKNKLRGGIIMELEEKGYNLASVADCLGLKVRTVRQWIHDGKLKAYKPKGAKQWIVMESELRRVQGGYEN